MRGSFGHVPVVARGAHATALAGLGDQEIVLALVAVAATLNGLNGGDSDHRLIPLPLAMGPNAARYDESRIRPEDERFHR